MDFEVNHPYTETLQVTFGDMSPQRLSLTLQDGRGSAWLFYEYLIEKYNNLHKVKFEDYPADFVSLPDGRIFQVRMVTEGGAALNQHKGNGIGRKPNMKEHYQNRKRLSGFILVDITEAPKYSYASVSIDKVPLDLHVSREDAQALISKAGLEPPNFTQMSSW